uniref:Myb/SANT-like domain-containing protein n=1 Tax=Fagus sylvatica TaxID=28930 RepID=A0A2N9HR41_FAGSY
MTTELNDADDAKLWPPNVEKLFMQLMIKEMVKGNMLGWDAETNTVFGSDEVWMNVLAAMPKAKEFRRKGCSLLLECMLDVDVDVDVEVDPDIGEDPEPVQGDVGRLVLKNGLRVGALARHAAKYVARAANTTASSAHPLMKTTPPVDDCSLQKAVELLDTQEFDEENSLECDMSGEENGLDSDMSDEENQNLGENHMSYQASLTSLTFSSSSSSSEDSDSDQDYRCISAIDGTHVRTSVPAVKKTSCHGRKHVITQNVMCAVEL